MKLQVQWAGYDCEICVVVLNPDLTFPNRKEKSGVGRDILEYTVCIQ